MTKTEKHAELCTADEVAVMDRHGKALWSAMADVAILSNHYPEGDALNLHRGIAYLAFQAVVAGVAEGSGRYATDAIVVAAGRIIGMMLAQARTPEQVATAQLYLDGAIERGRGDYLKARGDMLAAEVEAGR